MWIESSNKDEVYENINKTLLNLKGELTDEEARISLCEFLRYNLKFTTFLLTGIRLAPYQSILINAWFKRNFCLNVLGRGCGKSEIFSNDSKVIVKGRGLIGLEDLFPNLEFKEDEYWHEFPIIELWNGNTWQKTNKILVQPDKDCMRVTTRYGYSLGGSTRHLIKVYDPKTLRIEWKQYSDIQVGDLACISRRDVAFGNAEKNNEAYLVGLLIGDGCYSSSTRQLKFTSADDQLIDYVSSFGSNSIKIDKRTAKTRDVVFNYEYARNFLSRHNLERCLSYDKAIPAHIFSSKEDLASCLSGLYDTDGGYEKNGSITFCSTSQTLVKQIQTALLTFGIVSNIRFKKTKSKFGKVWIVVISGHNVDKFISSISFKLERKNNKNFLLKPRNTNLDVIPGAKEALKRIRDRTALTKEQAKEWHDNIEKRCQKHIGYSMLERSLSFFKKIVPEDKEVKLLEDLCFQNFFFDPVLEKENFNHNCIDFNVPAGEMYWSNGFISHNTFCAGIFALLYAIFNPGKQILVVSATFRSSRRILEAIDQLAKSQGGKLLAQVFQAPMAKRGDQFTITFGNGSGISAVPLGNSDKLRGLRCHVLLLDETLLIPKITIQQILMPFLNSASGITEKMRIRSIEDKLIRKGKLKESERKYFESDAKMIMLSSASFTFDYLYEIYQDYLEKIRKGEFAKKYFVSQLSYEVVPKDLLEPSIIDEMINGTISQAIIDRELKAIFSSGSDGYFSAKKMFACSTTDGQKPIVEIIGEKGAQYVLAADPSFSSAEYSDHFAFCLLKIVEKKDGKKIGMVVHQYAIAGGDLKDHIAYFHYLLTSFNVVWIAIDSTGGDSNEFINSCNNSKLFQNEKIELNDIEADFKKDYSPDIIKEIKQSYNVQARRIVQKQSFSSNFQRAANEYLQACFDYQNILFAGKVCATDGGVESMLQNKPAIIEEHSSFNGPEESVYTFIENQDDLIDLVRKECALIEVSSSSLGAISYDLPQSMRRSRNPLRARKDSYSALLLANWGLKLYLETLSIPEDDTQGTFQPFAA